MTNIKKQKALRYIDHTLKLDITEKDYYLKVSAKLYEIRKLVNDIGKKETFKCDMCGGFFHE